VDTVRILTTSGVDLNAKDEDGNTALEIAKDEEEDEIVDVLRGARKGGGSAAKESD